MAGTVTAMFLLVMIILITSFQIAIYGNSEYRFYEKEYRKYRVTEDLHMSMENVMKVTDYMMDYLIGREEVLSVKTEVAGRRQDFFNEQDRLHMADVRKLFLGGFEDKEFPCGVSVAVLFLLSLSWKNRKEGQRRGTSGINVSGRIPFHWGYSFWRLPCWQWQFRLILQPALLCFMSSFFQMIFGC